MRSGDVRARGRAMTVRRDRTLPVTNSVSTPVAVRAAINDAYGPIGLVRYQILKASLHDTYLIAGRGQHYVAWVYHPSWRSLDDIGYQLDPLPHLAGRRLERLVDVAPRLSLRSRAAHRRPVGARRSTNPLLSPEAVAAKVVRAYSLKRVAAARHLRRGVHKTHLLTAAADRCATQICRRSEVSAAEVRDELELFADLARQRVPVALPVTASDRSAVTSLAVDEANGKARPEGK
jgi:Ser/Thr protein kinase RdoA (MazF antagonist)